MACVIVAVLMAAAATERVMLTAIGLFVTAMPTVSTMHEQMHERTGQQQQEWQVGNDVGPVLGQQEVPGDGKKAEEEPVDTAGAAMGNIMASHN
jgi:hypothetical protein